MDTQKKTFHCKTTTEQELTGKKILQNCRNQLYLDFPYLDGAFTSLEYKADMQMPGPDRANPDTIDFCSFAGFIFR